MAILPVRRSGSEALERGVDPLQRMADLMNWDPFGEMAVSPWGRGGENFSPAFEVKETKEGYLFVCDVPGIKEEDLEVNLDGNRLSVSGKREAEKKEESERYYSYERSYGSFQRTFTLPSGIDESHLRAELKDGVLSIHIPKSEASQAKRVKIESGAKVKS